MKMRKLLLRPFVVIAAILAMTFGVSTPAHAWGSQSNCTYYAGHTNRWAFFAGHNVDASLRMCASAKGIWWVKTPEITYPSRGPQGALESVDTITAPFVVDVNYLNGVAQQVTYRWSTRQCVFASWGPLCNTFDFKVKVAHMSSQICSVGGSCDAWKQW